VIRRRLSAAGAFLLLSVGGMMAAAVAGSSYEATAGEYLASNISQPVAPPAPRVPPLAAPPVSRPHAIPARLQIPAIGVDTAVQSLGLRADGTLQQPSGWQIAGWYRGSVPPGDVGPSIIIGHVDSINGPAVFFRLRQLHPGQRVIVVGRDSQPVSFVIDQIASYPKNNFPVNAVYGPSSVPELRLVTCTGDFDYAARSYLDNLVVSAHLA
jgi:sortase (surface protein transpeptidase)